MFHRAGFRVLAFQRSHEYRTPHLAFLSVLELPLQLLRVPAVARIAGTQMEFIIQKADKS
jgi:hypothetical protein